MWHQKVLLLRAICSLLYLHPVGSYFALELSSSFFCNKSAFRKTGEQPKSHLLLRTSAAVAQSVECPSEVPVWSNSTVGPNHTAAKGGRENTSSAICEANVNINALFGELEKM